MNVPLSEDTLTRGDIRAELAEVVAGKKPGRTSDDDVTVFDSTVLAIQDIATAWLVYQKAEEEGMGSEIDLLNL